MCPSGSELSHPLNDILKVHLLVCKIHVFDILVDRNLTCLMRGFIQKEIGANAEIHRQILGKAQGVLWKQGWGHLELSKPQGLRTTQKDLQSKFSWAHGCSQRQGHQPGCWTQLPYTFVENVKLCLHMCPLTSGAGGVFISFPCLEFLYPTWSAQLGLSEKRPSPAGTKEPRVGQCPRERGSPFSQGKIRNNVEREL